MAEDSTASVRDSPFVMGKEISQESTTRESSQQEAKAVTTDDVAQDADNKKSLSPTKSIGMNRVRRNKKKAMFSVPINIPFNVYDDVETP